MLAPLTDLTKMPKCTKKNDKIPWNEKYDKAFQKIKEVIAGEKNLACPDFNKTFDVHVDASDLQLGGVVSQDGKPIAFYSRKLSETQKGYTVEE